MDSLQEQGGLTAISQESGPPPSNNDVKLGGSDLTRTEERNGEYVEPSPQPIWTPSEFHDWTIWRAAIAEFIATLLFLYIAISAVIGNERERPDGVGALGVAWSFGATIFVLVYCTAGVSGGHINPAVTLGLFLARRISASRALLYVIAQILGGISGAGLVKAMQKNQFQQHNGGTNIVNPELTSGVGLAAEIVGTFILVYVVFCATDAKGRASEPHVPILAPLSIGLAVFVVHLATIPITGTGINPARSFGTAVVWNHKLAWDDQWIFWVGPFIGACLAAAYHQFVIRSLPLGFYFLFPSSQLTVASVRSSTTAVRKGTEQKTSG